MRGFRKAFGHVETYKGKTRIQIANRYKPRTFYALTKLCESEGVSVNAKVNEIVERFLGVRNG